MKNKFAQLFEQSWAVRIKGMRILTLYLFITIVISLVGGTALAKADARKEKDAYLLRCKGATMIMLLNFQPKTDQVEMKRYAIEVCDLGMARLKNADFLEHGGQKLGCMDGVQFGIAFLPESTRVKKRVELWKDYCKI